MRHVKMTVSAAVAVIALGAGVTTALADTGQLSSDGYYHYFVGYTDQTSTPMKTVSAYINHGANPVSKPDPESSVWTMGTNASAGSFEQTGLIASVDMYNGNPGTGEPVYFFAEQDGNGTYNEIDGSYGSAVGANNLYSATWSYNSGGTDTLAGYVNGHSAGSFTTGNWPIPNTTENLMEETDSTSTDTSDGMGSETSPEIFSDMQYTSTSGTTTNVTTGTSAKDAGYEHFMSGSDAQYFGVFDGRNDG